MNPYFPRLFEPIRIGSKEARNRVMRLATVTNTGASGLPSRHTVEHYRTVARGGAGMIVTEAMRVHPSNAGRTAAILLYREETIASLRELTEAVHAEGALFIAQLNHGGRQHHAHEIPTVWGPSPVACPQSGGVPHVMTKEEIADVVAGFASTARHAKLAGFDGVEIHGAQGHLIQQFVSAFSNQRDDEYGGTLENRLRFPLEILAAVRAQVGPDFIVGYRMGVEEFSPGGVTIEESRITAVQLTSQAQIDFLSLAQGNFNTIEEHLPEAHYPPTTYVDLHAQVKAVAGGIPVVTSSRIQTPAQSEAIIAAGKADIVGLCRALIADPYWPAKAEQGRAADITPCITCNRCWGLVVDSKRIACTVNPACGAEAEMPSSRVGEEERGRTSRPKSVVVSGGGPAGLEAARTAALRGHRVTLFESGSSLGGKLNFAHHYRPYHELEFAREYLVEQVGRLDIDVRLKTPATRDSVMSVRPDLAIVATGSEILAPVLPGDGSVRAVVYSGAEPGETVVVMDEDGYFWASCMTEQLARRGCNVIYVTRFNMPFRELPQVSQICTLRVLSEHGVVTKAAMYVDRAENGHVVLRHYYDRKHEERVSAREVLWIGAQRARDGLAAELRETGLEDVRIIGDAFAPRRLSYAIAEGQRAGRL